MFPNAVAGPAGKLPATLVPVGWADAALVIIAGWVALPMDGITASNMPALQKRLAMSFPSGFEFLYRLRPVNHIIIIQLLMVQHTSVTMRINELSSTTKQKAATKAIHKIKTEKHKNAYNG